MGLISRGMSWLARIHAERDSVTVTYLQMGTADGIEVAAVVGSQRANSLKVGAVSEATTEWAERDYLIRVEDWATAGLTGEPQRGDRITETINEVDHVFELFPAVGEPPWRWSDEDRTTYRVHTKRVA